MREIFPFHSMHLDLSWQKKHWGNERGSVHNTYTLELAHLIFKCHLLHLCFSCNDEAKCLGQINSHEVKSVCEGRPCSNINVCFMSVSKLDSQFDINRREIIDDNNKMDILHYRPP